MTTFLLYLFHSLFWAVPQYVPVPFTKASATVTFTTVQFLANGATACDAGGVASCTITVSSTTAGNFGLICGFGISGGGGASSTAPTNEGTWIHTPSMAQLDKLNAAAGAFYDMDCWHSLSLTGGVTSIIWHWSGVTPDDNVIFVEVHRSSGSFVIDASTSTTDTSCTACAGPSGVSLSSTDYLVHIALNNQTFSSFTGVTAEYQINGTNGTTTTTYMAADINTQSSYVQPTWNLTPTDVTPVGVVAIK